MVELYETTAGAANGLRAANLSVRADVGAKAADSALRRAGPLRMPPRRSRLRFDRSLGPQRPVSAPLAPASDSLAGRRVELPARGQSSEKTVFGGVLAERMRRANAGGV